MRILLMNTCGVAGTVALADTAVEPPVVATAVLPGRSASERLVPAVRGLMEVQGWRLAELAAVVVVHGPGSFTGVRVGLSAAKGLSEAGGVPLVGISRLAVLAAAVKADAVFAVADAGRGEFYLGEYGREGVVEEAMLPLSAVLSRAAGGRVVVCEAKVAEALEELHPTLVEEPVAGDALGLVLERIGRGAFDDAAVLDANYLRRTDTEILARLAVHAAAHGGEV